MAILLRMIKTGTPFGNWEQKENVQKVYNFLYRFFNVFFSKELGWERVY